MRRIISALLTASFVSATGIQAQSVTWDANGHTYQTVLAQNPSWFTARDLAAGMSLNGVSGHLATLATRAEQEFVVSALGGGPAVNQLWLGGYQDPNAPDYSEPYGGWRWITGEPWLGVSPGDPLIPRADAGFNDLYFDGRHEGVLITWWQTGGINDYVAEPSPALGDTNGGPSRGFLVEFDSTSTPEPASLVLLATGMAAILLAAGRMRRRD